MNAKAKELLADALGLPEAERATLAAELIASLDPHGDEQAWDQWDREVARRAQELDSGSVKPVPWTEVRQRLMGQ
jgi:putative addiction module component (TIGR02574 family)